MLLIFRDSLKKMKVYTKKEGLCCLIREENCENAGNRRKMKGGGGLLHSFVFICVRRPDSTAMFVSLSCFY